MERQRPGRPTALEERARFVVMWVGGMSARAIAQATGASTTTVSKWIRRWKRDGNVSTRPRPGRPCCGQLPRKYGDTDYLGTIMFYRFIIVGILRASQYCRDCNLRLRYLQGGEVLYNQSSCYGHLQQ